MASVLLVGVLLLAHSHGACVILGILPAWLTTLPLGAAFAAAAYGLLASSVTRA